MSCDKKSVLPDQDLNLGHAAREVFAVLFSACLVVHLHSFSITLAEDDDNSVRGSFFFPTHIYYNLDSNELQCPPLPILFKVNYDNTDGNKNFVLCFIRQTNNPVVQRLACHTHSKSV